MKLFLTNGSLYPAVFDLLQVMHALVGAVRELDAAPDVRALVLTGRGRAFAAGADIREMAQLSAVEAEAIQLFAAWQDIAIGGGRTTPLIAAVNGLALGGGCEVAMLCDVVIAASDASFGLVRHP